MKQIIIASHPANTRVCIVEDGKLVEFWVERESTERIVGNIYKGKVMNVLPGMASAFVNIGLEKNAFLYAGDMIDEDGSIKETNGKLNVKVGDVTTSSIPKALAMPFVNVVLPAPKSPFNKMISPPTNLSATCFAILWVSSML